MAGSSSTIKTRCGALRFDCIRIERDCSKERQGRERALAPVAREAGVRRRVTLWMSAMPPLPRKKVVALELLDRASVFIHLDPRRPGVIVPPNFLKQPQLVLQIGLNMAIPIHDLEVTDEGISCTLSFNKRPHFCSLPWTSIYALIGEQGGGMVWPEDVPPEVVSQHRAAAKKVTKPALRSLGTDSADRSRAAPAQQRQTEARPPSSRPPRLVPLSNPEAASAVSSKAGQADVSKSGTQPVSGVAGSGATKRERPPYLRLVR